MKKIFFPAFLGLMCVCIVNAQTLDETILAAAVKFSNELPENTRAAIIDFKSISDELNNYVLDELYGHILRNRKIIPVRPDPHQRRLSGDFYSIGQLLETEYIITGSIEFIGGEYKFYLSAADAEQRTQKSHYTASLNLRNDQLFSLLLTGVAQSSKSEMVRSERPPRMANIRNNWISGDLLFGVNSQGIGFGASARYEKMLNQKISISVNMFFIPYNLNIIFDDYNERNFSFGTDIFLYFYPWGKTFFLGFAMGYRNEGYYRESERERYYVHGPEFSLDFGWKIDVGSEGGFFLRHGALFTSMMNFKGGFFGFYLSAGWAF